jgi:glutaredoxin 3
MVKVLHGRNKPQPRAIVFSTPTCSFYNKAKKYFREKGIKFKAVEVNRDPVAARDMVRRVGQQRVLIRDIGGKVVVSFDRPKSINILGSKPRS